MAIYTDDYRRHVADRDRHIHKNDAWPTIEGQLCTTCRNYSLDYWANAVGHEWQECSLCGDRDILRTHEWADFKLFKPNWSGIAHSGIGRFQMQVRALENEIRFIQTYGPHVSHSSKSISTRFGDEGPRVKLKDHKNFDDAVARLLLLTREQIDVIRQIIERYDLTEADFHMTFREHTQAWMRNQQAIYHQSKMMKHFPPPKLTHLK